MAPIRLAVCIGTLGAGGSERQVVTLLRTLDRQRVRPFLYVVDENGPLRSAVPDDVPVASFLNRCPARRQWLPGGLHRRRVRDLADWLSDQQIDVCYDRTFLMSLIAADAAQRKGIPNICTLVTDPVTGFDPVAGRFAGRKRRLLTKLYGRSAALVAVSDGVRSSAAHFYEIPLESLRTIRNGVDLDWVRQSPPDEAAHAWRRARRHAFRIVTAGRLTEQKGFQFLVRALARLADQDPAQSIHCAILGDGPFRESLDAEIRSSGQTQRIELMGHQPNPLGWFREADLFVLPSLLEGMPNVLLEAMAVGTPVLSTDCPSGPREILVDGRFGSLVLPADAEALASAIRHARRDPQQLHRTALAATRHVETELSARAATEKITELVESVAR